MSQFMPEQTQPSPTGVSQFTPSSPATTQDDVALMQRVFQAAAANPLMLPTDFMAYVLDYVQTSRLIIPLGQVFGFSNTINRGTGSLSWPGVGSASNFTTINHGLSRTPSTIIIQINSGTLTAFPTTAAVSPTETTFQVRANTVDGQVPLVTDTNTFYWFAQV